VAAVTHLIAVDLGADSGRVVLGTLRDGKLAMDVVHRFANTPQHVAGHLRWDLTALWNGIREGLRLASRQAGGPVASIAVDTWGVDYGLVDASGELLDQPIHYRDERTVGIPEAVAQVVPPEEHFARTGTRGLVFNTVYQVVAEQRERPELLQRAHRLLTIPDLLGYWLSGTMANEWSNAGTTGLTIAGKPEWDRALIAQLGLPDHLFGPIVRSGADLGPLRAELACELGFATAPRIIAPGCHDTASAVASMPTAERGTAFISCGTWSLMGVLLKGPVTGPEAFTRDLSNEIAVDGRIRLLKNIMGLWVWQECRRDLLAEGVELSHAELAALATAAVPQSATFDIDHPSLLVPSSAGERMIDRVRRLGGNLPMTAPGDLFRRITEALAAAYAKTRLDLERITGEPVRAISLMGGGCRNKLLCQLTAEACSVTVLAGPDEGTAFGNLLVQARSLGLVDDAGMAAVSAASSEIATYVPGSRLAAGA
jgi:rhamnulokinase